MTPSAMGQTFTWTNLLGGSWGTGTNWNTAPTFGSGVTLNFSTLNITANATTTLDGNRTAGSLSFADATTASHDWIVNTGTPTSGTLTLAATGTPSIGVTNRTATISAVVAGTQGFTKTGAGTLLLNNAANTVTGTITISGGLLSIRDGTTNTPAVFNNLTSKAITVQNAATLDLPRLHATTATTTTWTLPPVTLESGSTLRFRHLTGSNTNNMAANIATSGATAVTIDSNGGAFQHEIALTGLISGSAPINFFASSGSGSTTATRTLTLNNTSTTFSGNWFVDYTGSTSDDFVALRSGAAGALGTGSVSLDDRARLINNAANGINSLTGVSLLKSTSFLDLNGSNSWNNNAASLTLNAGTITLASANSSIGAMTIGGSATLTGTTGNLAPGSILITAGTLSGTGTLAPRDSATIANTGATTGPAISAALNLDASGITFNLIDSNLSGSDLFLNGAVTSSAGFTKTGAGALAFGGATTITGPVAHNQGILQFNNAGAKSFTGGISGSGTLSVGGTGLTTFSGPSSSFTGNISVATNANFAGEANTAGNLTFSDGANFWPDVSTEPAAFQSNNLTLNGVTSIRFASTPTPGTYTLLRYTGSLTGSAANLSTAFRGASLDMGTGANSSVTLTIGAAANLTWNNAASTGLWNINTDSNWLRGLANDTYFELDNVFFDDTPGTDQTISVATAVAPASVTFNNAAVSYTLSGSAISGFTGLVKNNSGTLTLSSANTFSGGTTLNDGTLRLGDAAAVGSGTLTLAAGRLTSVGSNALTLAGPIALTGPLSLGDATDNGAITISTALSLPTSASLDVASPVTLSGVLSGASSSLTKSGASSLVLTGTNTYGGVTTVTGGILQIGSGAATGVLPGSATISSPGILRFFRNDSSLALNQNFSGSGTLAFAGTGTSGQSSYTLGGDNSGLTGSVVVENGARAQVGASNRFGTAAVTVQSGGSVSVTTAGTNLANAFTIAGNGWNESAGQLGAIRLQDSAVISGPITVSGSARITAHNGAAGTITGTITGGALENLQINSTLASNNGTITYAGNGSAFIGRTFVSQGSFNLTGSLGGDLEITSGTPVATLAGEGTVGGKLLLGIGAVGANLIFDPATPGALAVAGDVALESSTNLSFASTPTTAGTFTVMTYGGALNTSLGSFAPPTGFRNPVVNTATPGQVTLTIDSKAVTWVGTPAATWDLGTTSNWSDGVASDFFFNLDSVTFGDSASSFAPTLAVTVIPTSVAFTNAANEYTLSGAGSIGGAGTLSKSGAANVTISTANTFTGNVSITGGRLTLGNAGALGASTNGAKQVTVTSGGQLDLNNFNNATPTRSYTLRLSGDGGGSGAIVNNSGTGIASNAGLLNLELLGNTTIGGSQRYDLGFSSGAASGTITGNGFTLTKTGANQVNLRGPATNLPSIIVNQGILGVETEANALGGASGLVTVNNTAVLGVWGALSIPTPVDLNNGATLRALGGGAATWNGTITLNGASTVDLSGQAKTIAGTITGTGSFTKSGTNALTLSGNNNHSGGTTITLGEVNVNSATAFGTGTVTFQHTTSSTTITRANFANVTVANNFILNTNAQTGFRGPINTAAGNTLTTLTGTITVQSGVGNGGHFSSADGGVLRLTGTINSTGAQPNIRSGVVEMGTTGGNLTVLQHAEGTLRLVANNGIQATLDLRLGVSGASTLDLNGFNQTLAQIKRNVPDQTTGTSHAATITNTSTAPSVLTIDGSVNHSFSGTINNGTGGISLIKKGSSTLTLNGAQTYTGDTTVEAGTLSINNAFMADGSAVRFVTGATLNLTHSATDKVDKLFINGVQQPAGIYDKDNSSFITGTGKLDVTTGPSVDAFGSWALGKGLDGSAGKEAGFSDDPDGDGFDNGLEWILGGNPLSQDAASLVTSTASATGGLTLTFTREDDSIGQATLSVEYDADLAGTWSSVPVGATSSGPDANGVTITINPTPDPDAITVNIPASNAANGKLFGRLKASKP